MAMIMMPDGYVGEDNDVSRAHCPNPKTLGLQSVIEVLNSTLRSLQSRDYYFWTG